MAKLNIKWALVGIGIGSLIGFAIQPLGPFRKILAAGGVIILIICLFWIGLENLGE